MFLNFYSLSCRCRRFRRGHCRCFCSVRRIDNNIIVAGAINDVKVAVLWQLVSNVDCFKNATVIVFLSFPKIRNLFFFNVIDVLNSSRQSVIVANSILFCGTALSIVRWLSANAEKKTNWVVAPLLLSVLLTFVKYAFVQRIFNVVIQFYGF